MDSYKESHDENQIQKERETAGNLDIECILSDAVLVTDPIKMLRAFTILEKYAKKYPENFTVAQLQYLYHNLIGKSNYVRFFFSLLGVLAKKQECVNRIFVEELNQLMFEEFRTTKSASVFEAICTLFIRLLEAHFEPVFIVIKSDEFAQRVEYIIGKCIANNYSTAIEQILNLLVAIPIYSEFDELKHEIILFTTASLCRIAAEGSPQLHVPLLKGISNLIANLDGKDCEPLLEPELMKLVFILTNSLNAETNIYANTALMNLTSLEDPLVAKLMEFGLFEVPFPREPKGNEKKINLLKGREKFMKMIENIALTHEIDFINPLMSSSWMPSIYEFATNCNAFSLQKSLVIISANILETSIEYINALFEVFPDIIDIAANAAESDDSDIVTNFVNFSYSVLTFANLHPEESLESSILEKYSEESIDSVFDLVEENSEDYEEKTMEKVNQILSIIHKE